MKKWVWLFLITWAFPWILYAESLEDPDKAFNAAWADVDFATKSTIKLLTLLEQDPQRTRLFIEAANSWERFREAQAEFDASEGTGDYRKAYLESSIKLLRERAALLNQDFGPFSKADEKHPVEIRLENQTGFDLEAIKAFNMEDFGALKRKALSNYHVENGAFQYTYVEAFAGKAKHIFQPTDYVGETPLEPGNYTFILSLTGGPPPLDLDLICRKDK